MSERKKEGTMEIEIKQKKRCVSERELRIKKKKIRV